MAWVITLAVSTSRCQASQGYEVIEAVIARCYQKAASDQPPIGVPKQRITPRTQSRFSMLPENDTGFHSTTSLVVEGAHEGFEKVGGEHTVTGPLLSLRNLNPSIQVGDIVVLRPTRANTSSGPVPPLLLFYCGEQAFPGLAEKTADKLTNTKSADDDESHLARFSFFLFPYVEGVEWNTYPPRQHKRLREWIISHGGLWQRITAFLSRFWQNLTGYKVGETAHKYTQMDPRRGVRWLNTRISDNYCGIFHKDQLWAKPAGKKQLTFTFQVYRVIQPCNEYIALKSHLPSFESLQTRRKKKIDEDCFFAAYAEATIYNQKAGKVRIRSADIEKAERALIRNEITDPPANTPQYRSAAFLRQVLFQGQGQKGINTGGKTWKSANDANLRDKLLNNVTWWQSTCFEARRNALKIQEVSAEPKDLDSLYSSIRNLLKQDKPILCGFLHGAFSDGPLKPWRTSRHGIIHFNDPDGGEQAAHFVVVTGIRTCGTKRYVHFAYGDGITYFVDLENLSSVMKDTIESPDRPNCLKIPSNWKPNKPLEQKDVDDVVPLPLMVIVEE